MTSASVVHHPASANESSSATIIRLAIVDDHALFREGLVRLLSLHDRFRLVAAEGTMEAAMTSLSSQPIDVLLLHEPHLALEIVQNPLVGHEEHHQERQQREHEDRGGPSR